MAHPRVIPDQPQILSAVQVSAVVCLAIKGETITRVNGNVSFIAGKRLQNF